MGKKTIRLICNAVLLYCLVHTALFAQDAAPPEYDVEQLFERFKNSNYLTLNEVDRELYRLTLREPRSANKWLRYCLEKKDKSATYLSGLYDAGNFIDFTPLLDFANLETLNIVNRYLTSIDGITVLSQMEKLTDLTIWAEQVTDTSPLSALVNLKYLSVDTKTRTDASELLPLVNLEALVCSPESTKAIQNISNLTGLKYLYLEFEPEGMNLSSLQNLVHLQELLLRGDIFTDPEFDTTALGQLNSLEKLTMSGFTLTNVQPLLSFPKLSWLNIMFCEINEENLALLEAGIEQVYSAKDKDH